MTSASTWAYTMSCSDTGSASDSRVLTGSRPDTRKYSPKCSPFSSPVMKSLTQLT